MQITCTNCERMVPRSDVNVGQHVARCRQCNTVFDLPAQLGAVVERPIARHRAPVPQPISIHVNELASTEAAPADPYRAGGVAAPSFEIVRRWWGADAILLVLVCVAVDAFVALKHSAFILDVSGVLLTYMTVATCVNRTVIRVERGFLSIRHGPLPWSGNKRIPLESLEQVFCLEEVRQSGRSGPTIRYSVRAVMKGGRAVVLVAGLKDPAEARAIEQALESRLGIVDVPVAGEMR